MEDGVGGPEQAEEEEAEEKEEEESGDREKPKTIVISSKRRKNLKKIKMKQKMPNQGNCQCMETIEEKSEMNTKRSSMVSQIRRETFLKQLQIKQVDSFSHKSNPRLFQLSFKNEYESKKIFGFKDSKEKLEEVEGGREGANRESTSSTTKAK